MKFNLHSCLSLVAALCFWPRYASFRASSLHISRINGAAGMNMVLDVTSISSTLVSAAAVTGVVAIHEAGHFIAARSQRMKISSFNVGYGPKLLSFNESGTGTEFSLRLVPLGGYVAFPSNVEFDEKEEIRTLSDPDLLENRPVLQRMKVIVAGVLANLLLSASLSTGAAMTTGISVPTFDHGVVVQSIASGTPATLAGLQPRDVIKSVNGKTLKDSSLSVNEFISTVRRNEGKQLLLLISRQTATQENVDISAVVIPQRNEKGTVTIGLGIAPNVKSINFEKATNIIDVSSI